MFRDTQSDKLRPPDWRHRRALALLHEGCRPSRHDDAGMAELLEFLRAVARRQGGGRHRRLAERRPDLAAAYAVAAGDPARRWAVEARVLAGEPADAIAGKHGLRPGTVETYERVYFDVRGRLAAVDWVALEVVRRDPGKALAEQEPRVLALVVGFFAGAQLLDVLLGGGDPVGRAELEKYLAEDALATALRNQAVAARALPADAETAGRLLRLATPGSTGAGGYESCRAGEIVRRQVDAMLPGEPRQPLPAGVPQRAA